MAGFQTIIVLAAAICAALCIVKSQETRDIGEDYFNRYFGESELDDLPDENSIQRFLERLQLQRNKKDPCLIGAGLSSPCNVKDALHAARQRQMIERLGRRKRRSNRK